MSEARTIDTITVGLSWGCRFRTQTFVNPEGHPIDTRNLQVGEPVKDGTPGWYEGFGVIQTRDTSRKLVEVYDQTYDRTWVVSWNDCWDIDEIEWVDKET
jgi:hypothetical protein